MSEVGRHLGDEDESHTTPHEVVGSDADDKASILPDFPLLYCPAAGSSFPSISAGASKTTPVGDRQQASESQVQLQGHARSVQSMTFAGPAATVKFENVGHSSAVILTPVLFEGPV